MAGGDMNGGNAAVRALQGERSLLVSLRDGVRERLGILPKDTAEALLGAYEREIAEVDEALVMIAGRRAAA